MCVILQFFSACVRLRPMNLKQQVRSNTSGRGCVRGKNGGVQSEGKHKHVELDCVNTRNHSPSNVKIESGTFVQGWFHGSWQGTANAMQLCIKLNEYANPAGRKEIFYVGFWKRTLPQFDCVAFCQVRWLSSRLFLAEEISRPPPQAYSVHGCTRDL